MQPSTGKVTKMTFPCGMNLAQDDSKVKISQAPNKRQGKTINIRMLRFEWSYSQC